MKYSQKNTIPARHPSVLPANGIHGSTELAILEVSREGLKDRLIYTVYPQDGCNSIAAEALGKGQRSW